MSANLEQFEQAAQELNELSTLFNASQASGDPLMLTADWVKRVDRVLRAGGAMVAWPDLSRSTCEVAHYRGALLKMKQVLEQYERLLSSYRVKLQSEQTRIKRVHAWADAVEFLR